MSSARKLDPLVALLLSLVGLGYPYVGKLTLGVAILLGVFLAYATLGWTGLLFQPLGSYLVVGLLVIVVFLWWVLPPVVAWRQKAAPPKRYNRWYFYLAWVIGLQFVVELWVSNLADIAGFRIFSYPSRSMEPTLHQGDRMTVDTWRYREQDPRAGEIVAFHHGDLLFAKRLVALPGQSVEIRDGILFRNGMRVDERYLDAKLDGGIRLRDIPPTQLGPTEFYVLGDFRDMSRDSRTFGPIAKHQILGRVESVCFSLQGFYVAWDRFGKDLADDN